MSDEVNPMADSLFYERTIQGFAPGQRVFERFSLRQMVGAGGMGQVWLALDEELGEEIALKFVWVVGQLDEAAIQEMKAETRHSRRLAHPNIVKVYDFVSGGSGAAISMEYVRGQTLSALRAKRPGLFFEADDIAPWVQQVLAALQYAHEDAKIIHRDLKPSNVMVDEAGKVKITDFGISANIAESVSRMTTMRGSSGTLVYMSPQQAMGEAPKVTDDIYALGATLYELLTSKPPFYRGGAAVLVQAREVVPPFMSARRAELNIQGRPIPAVWESVVASCLEKDPALRPASAAEMARRLASPAPDVTRRVPLPPPPPTAPGPGQPGGGSSRGGWGGLITVGVIVGLLVVGGIIAALSWQDHKEQDRLHQLQADAKAAQDRAAAAEQKEQELRDAQLQAQKDAEAAKAQADAAAKQQAADKARADAEQAAQAREAADAQAKAAAAKAQAEAQAQTNAPAVVPPNPAPAPSPPPETPPVADQQQMDRKAALDQFFDGWWNHNKSNVAADWAADFAPMSNYCWYDGAGQAPREFIDGDRQKLIDQWPDRNYSLIKLNYEWVDGDNVRAEANYDWDYSGVKGEKRGNCSLTMGVHWNGSGWEIASYQEQDRRTPAMPTRMAVASGTPTVFDRKASLDQFFNSWWRHNASNVAADWAADFAPNSNYCWYTGGGLAPRSFVEQDRETLIEAWPVRRYHLVKLDYSWIDSLTVQTTAVYNWDYAGAKGEKSGRCALDINVEWNGVAWEITSYRENDTH
jgi:serine/threonine protein kinase